jgi:hypothetical protein
MISTSSNPLTFAEYLIYNDDTDYKYELIVSRTFPELELIAQQILAV